MSTTEFRSYSERFPPANRVATGLDTVAIEIVDGNGTHRYNPNSSTLAAHSGAKGFNLGAPVAISDISNAPAYYVRLDSGRMALTADEMVRLFMFNLRPDEFFSLANKYGVFYEISGKFYDETTGVAWDPRYTYAEQEERHALANVPHVLVVPGQVPSFHSIVTFDQAEALIRTFADTFEMRAVSVRLHQPEPGAEGPTALDPFGNIVTLFTYEDDSMRAYGPFDTPERAMAYEPEDHPPGSKVKSRHSAGRVIASCGAAE